MTTLLNPYSYALKKDPIWKIDREPIFTVGSYKLYRYYPDHFIYTYKNIVIMERTGANEKMLIDLNSGVEPLSEARLYHDFKRPIEAIKNGLEIAAKIGFTVE